MTDAPNYASPTTVCMVSDRVHEGALAILTDGPGTACVIAIPTRLGVHPETARGGDRSMA